MKKLINHVDDLLAESLDGFAAAHKDIVSLGAERQFVPAPPGDAWQGRADLGRRLGHEPLHTGFVGHGMLDAACPGRSSHRRRRTRCSPPSRRSTAAPARCSS
jgi:dihydroxyacetone kinase-like protein